MSQNEFEININRGADIGTPIEHMPKPKLARERGGGGPNPNRVEGLDGEDWDKRLVPQGKDDPDFKQITSPFLQTQIRLLARRPEGFTNSEDVRGVYNTIDQEIGAGRLTAAEAALWQARMVTLYRQLKGDEEAKLQQAQRVNSPQTGSSFAQDLATALYGERLSKQEKYIEMLDDEQWNNGVIQPINPDNAPVFYIEMTNEERQLHQIRVEVNNACYLKRNNGFNLDALSKEKGIYTGLSKTETEKLYNATPGLRQAVKLYVGLIDGGREFKNERGGTFTLLTAKGRPDLLIIREAVRNTIRSVVQNDMEQKILMSDPSDQDKYEKRNLDKLDQTENRDILDLKCRDAEQVAFNLLFLGNTFESLDSKWSDDGSGQLVRNRAPQVTSEILSVGIRNAMKPLDNLITSLGKTQDKFKSVGKFGQWAYDQTRKANKGNPVELRPDKDKHVEEVVIIPETQGNGERFWTLENRGKRLLVPECYPVKIVGSVWEETTIKDGNEDVSLLTLIRRSPDGTIPWEQISGEDLWTDYSSKLSNAAVIWEALQGNAPLKFGSEIGAMEQWAVTINGALSKFEKRRESKIKRWILYASTGGVQVTKREPKILGSKVAIRMNLANKYKSSFFLPSEDLFFPWDQPSLFERLQN